MTDDDRPGFITPPPGLLPPPAPAPAAPPADSGTRRMPLGARAGVPTPVLPPRPIPAAAAAAAAPAPAPAVPLAPAVPPAQYAASVPPGGQAHAPDPVLGQAGVITRSSAATVWRLDLPHGLPSVTITGAALLGRAPSPIPAASAAALVAVADPARSVSKSHALLEPEGDAVWVTDLGSTNGTMVIDPGGVQRELPVGVRTRVASGCRLVLGEFEVRAARR